MGSLYTTLAVVALCASVGWMQAEAKKKELSKPNIIYILADDLGWNDVGYHNPKVQTPNIDRLAARGIELTNNYAQPLCSASRSALLTGKYPTNNGLQHLVLQPEGTTCLPVEHKTLPQYMKDEGYVTKMVGKWHLGYCHESCLPKQKGFDEFRGMVGGECDYWTWEDSGVMLKYTNNTPETKNLGKTHLTIQDRMDTRDMIMAHKGNPDPLFMYISPNAPHSPLKPTQSMFDVHDFLDENDKHSKNRRKYLGLVSALDDLVGETMLALADADMSENTVIIFQSDNGGSNISPPVNGFASYGNNYPLRNGKFSHYEGGVKVQGVYYDPRLEKSNRGTKRDFLMHITDWLPTFVQLANGNSTPTDIDGVSQVANLGDTYHSGDRYKVRDAVLINIDTMSNFKFVYKCTDRDVAFRYKDWKLITGRRTTWTYKEILVNEYKTPAESPELPTIVGDSCLTRKGLRIKMKCLFNVRDDPSETRNLYESEPEIVEQILGMIKEAKTTMVQEVYSKTLGATEETTQQLGEILVPRHGYCDPAKDFPLVPADPACGNADPDDYEEEDDDFDPSQLNLVSILED